jgi:class 3 adenylate cyclase/CHASE2 domain-containing sensor protein
MRPIAHLSAQSPWRRVVAMLLIAISTTTAAALIQSSRPIQQLGNVFYDWFYRQRPIEDQSAKSVLLIKVDQYSLDYVNKHLHRGWPWPRDYWPHIIHYLEKAKAKCIVFDLTFSERSAYAGELDDDTQFAQALDEATIPVILAQTHDSNGKPRNFAPPIRKPHIFASVDLKTDPLIRDYDPQGSLALATVQTTTPTLPPWANEDFRLHYYGPHQDKSGKFTFPYISAINVIASDFDPTKNFDIKPQNFRDKIVLIGTTAASTYDLKSSPYSVIYPGVEVHATAIENLLSQQRVRPIGPSGLLLTAGLVSLAGAAGGLFPRKTALKLATGLGVIAVLLLVSMSLFLRSEIVWLDPGVPILAAILSIILALGWSYFVEDRQSRFFIKALGQCVSPAVAEELRQDRSKLSISTEKRRLTILFSDIAGFTELSERLGEKIGPLLNYYLDQMSAPIIQCDGMLDKYIGDAVMSFWNAPLPQEDHAIRACRAALAMQSRLAEIQPQLAQLGAPGLAARIGISTGMVTFGMMGSSYKFNYSVIGDAVNFASRLEGANKLYDSGILIGPTTAALVRDKFVVRQLDMLRVKGKNESAAVYQLLGEGSADAHTATLIEQYESAFKKYQAMDWDSAERILLDVLSKFQEDGPSKVLLHRVHAFRQDPPGKDWNGIYVAREK